jgi:hypothetical protein
MHRQIRPSRLTSVLVWLACFNCGPVASDLGLESPAEIAEPSPKQHALPDSGLKGADAGAGDLVRGIDAGSTAAVDAGQATDAGAARDAGRENDAGAAEVLAEEKFGRRLVHYATVNKTEGWRKAYVEASSIPLLPASGPLPDGLTLVLEVENYANDAFLRVFKNGSWTSARFPRRGSSLVTTRDEAACRSCHLGAEAENTYTLSALRTVAQRVQPVVYTCRKPGPTPCPPEAYR